MCLRWPSSVDRSNIFSSSALLFSRSLTSLERCDLCHTCRGVYCRPSATWRALFKDRLSLMSPLAGNNSLTVFGEEQFKQLSFCCEGVYISADDSRDQRPERGSGWGEEWHHNDFLKSRRRAYKLYSFPQLFPPVCNPFAPLRLFSRYTWVCLRVRRGFGGRGDGWHSEVKCKGDFSTRFS